MATTRVQLLLGLLFLIPKGRGACSPLVKGGSVGLKLTGNATSGGDVTSGDTYVTVTVKCLSTGYTFINGVRRVPGVNVSHIDTDQSIVVQCRNDNKWYPNIWYKHTSIGVLEETEHSVYCAPGCHMIPPYSYEVKYPPGSITNEEYSPPVVPNNKLTVSLSCAEGYAKAVGDTGFASLQCKQTVSTGGSGFDAQWSQDENNRLTCVRGCKDITASVQYGETTATPSVIGDEPPFSAGDIVPFTCKEGFKIIGHSQLTCAGTNIWNEALPECVMKTGFSTKLSSSIILIICSIIAACLAD